MITYCIDDIECIELEATLTKLVKYKCFSKVRNWAYFRCEKVEHGLCERGDVLQMIRAVDENIECKFTADDKFVYSPDKEALFVAKLSGFWISADGE